MHLQEIVRLFKVLEIVVYGVDVGDDGRHVLLGACGLVIGGLYCDQMGDVVHGHVLGVPHAVLPADVQTIRYLYHQPFFWGNLLLFSFEIFHDGSITVLTAKACVLPILTPDVIPTRFIIPIFLGTYTCLIFVFRATVP